MPRQDHPRTEPDSDQGLKPLRIPLSSSVPGSSLSYFPSSSLRQIERDGFRRQNTHETLQHPAYPGAIWALQPNRHGKLNVAKHQSKTIKIAWEIHGNGPTKIVLIMGLAAIMSNWQRQTLYFGHERADQYTVLILDNRGAGESDKPLMRYTTREMAHDVVSILDHVGWTGKRELNVIGFSLGGMIAQELACAVPWRVQSLSLLNTTAKIRGEAIAPRKIVQWLSLFRPTTEEKQIAAAISQSLAADWLASPDAEVLPSPTSTPQCGPPDGDDLTYRHFDTNYQRFQAEELAKTRRHGSPSAIGFLCQMLAALGHRKSRARLGAMADAVGRDRILVMHGTADEAINVLNGRALIDAIQPIDALVVEGMGHMSVVERAQWVNQLLERKVVAGSEQKV